MSRISALLILLLAAPACSGGGGGGHLDDTGGSGDTGGGDTEPDAPADAPDIGEDAGADPEVEPDVEIPDPEDVICSPCLYAEDCQAPGSQCLELVSGETVCGWDCNADPDVCPEGTECVEIVASISQCVPITPFCENPCDLITCAEGEICTPVDGGECIVPAGLCGECESNWDCGEDNLCLRWDDIDSRTGCGQDCTADPESCPAGYFCVTVSDGDEDALQCVPEILTCVDRCVDVTCEVAGEVCDPRTGLCSPPPEPCAPCASDVDCGGGGNACIGLPGPDCREDADCGADGYCVDGSCGFPRCGLDCTVDPNVCPAGFACYALIGGRQQCLPVRLSCEDLCATVECEDGFNCDDVTGECIESTIPICGSPCAENAACGTYADICLNTGTTPFCAMACGTEQGPCPVGYFCAEVFAGVELCVPDTAMYDCSPCEETECAEGEVCNPLDGACIEMPVPCEDDTQCDAEFLCNTWEGRCDPIGAPCTLLTRFSACDFSHMACTAAAEGVDGTCEQSCFTDPGCPVDRPACEGMHGTFGGICVDPGIGGADTCGRLMSSSFAIGEPCFSEDPFEPGLCYGAANYCLMGADPSVPGLCTRACTSDEDCLAEGARCGETGGGRYCIPDICACMLDPTEGGANDLVGDMLDAVDLTRCGVIWTLSQRRTALRLGELHDGYRVPAANGPAGDPLQGDAALLPGIEALASERGSTGPSALGALRLAARARDVPFFEPSPHVPVAEDAPLVRSITRLCDARGSSPDPMLADQASAVPMEVQVAVAALIDDLTDALTLDAELYIDVDYPLAQQLASGLHATLYDGTTDVELDSGDVIGLIGRSWRWGTMIQIAADIAAAIEAFPREFPGDLGDVAFRTLTPFGYIEIGGSGSDTWEGGDTYALLIDLGGDDTYEIPAGANEGPNQPWSVVIDLAGADTYGYAEWPIPADAGLLPSDTAGRAPADPSGDGRVTRSSTSRQGAGRGGFGALYDLGPGHDTFASLRMSQGFGMLGTGILLDEEGDAELTIEALGQGAGLFGVGILIVGDAGARLNGTHGVMGFGGPAGVGILVGGAGADQYEAPVGDLGAETVLYYNRLRGPDANLTAGMGAGLGRAQDRNWTDPPVSGGAGVFIEIGGGDSYSASVGALGFGHWHGLGAFHDLGGDDRYDMHALGVGAGHRQGIGVFEDRAGTDTFGATTAPEMALGFGEDLGVGICADMEGNDTFVAEQYVLGYGTFNGLGLFRDGVGDDAYIAEGRDSFGVAVLTILGSEPESNPRRGLGTFGFFADGGGADTWERPDLVGAGIGADRTWTQISEDEEGLPVYGAGVDGAGSVVLRR